MNLIVKLSNIYPSVMQTSSSAMKKDPANNMFPLYCQCIMTGNTCVLENSRLLTWNDEINKCINLAQETWSAY